MGSYFIGFTVAYIILHIFFSPTHAHHGDILKGLTYHLDFYITWLIGFFSGILAKYF